MPQRRWRKLSATRSAVRIELAEPRALMSTAPKFDLVHCGLVLQHIPHSEGWKVLDQPTDVLLGILRQREVVESEHPPFVQTVQLAHDVGRQA